MRKAFAALACLALCGTALATDIISTDGFSNCGSSDSSIQVHKVDISFDRSSNVITFDVSGTSSEEQDVTATLIVEAYGIKVYNQTFDPCAADTKVDQLCPGEYSQHCYSYLANVLSSAQRDFRCPRYTTNT